MAPPRPLQDAMAIIASETYTATSAPIQHAAIAAFNGGDDIADEELSALGGGPVAANHLET